MRSVPFTAAALLAPQEIVFRDRVLGMLCAIIVGCGLLLLR
jgi:hypothetical protein